jgi:hypothetical protein
MELHHRVVGTVLPYLRIRIQVGKAAPAFGQPGGGQQVKLLEGISESCFQPGVPLK